MQPRYIARGARPIRGDANNAPYGHRSVCCLGVDGCNARPRRRGQAQFRHVATHKAVFDKFFPPTFTLTTEVGLLAVSKMRSWNLKQFLKLAGSTAAFFFWFVTIIRTASERATETLNEEKRLRGTLVESMASLLAEATSLREDWTAVYSKSGTLNSRARAAKLTLIATLQSAILALQQQANLVPPTGGRRAAAHAAQAICTHNKLLAEVGVLAADVRHQQEELKTMRSWLGSPFS